METWFFAGELLQLRKPDYFEVAAYYPVKKNREKIGKVLNNAKDQAVNYVEGVQKQAEEKKGEIKKEFVKDKKIVQKTVKNAKKVMHFK